MQKELVGASIFSSEKDGSAQETAGMIVAALQEGPARGWNTL